MLISNYFKLNYLIAIIVVVFVCFGVWFSGQRNDLDNDCGKQNTENDGASQDVTTNASPIESNSSGEDSRPDKFKCTSGNYISLDRACDGQSDCDDQSDETLEECLGFKCPNYAFQCGYGACIEKTKKCNGVNDCRDGSDETRKLCGEKSVPIISTISPHSSTVKQLTEGCKVPNIKNSVLKYDEDKRLIMPEETVRKGATMLYYCLPGYIRGGESSNYCNGSIWQNALHSNCFKSCPKDKLKGVTFTAACKIGDTSVPCNDQIKPGTIAKITCQERYKKPDPNSPDLLVCQDDGTWDYNPVACEAVCGEELLLTTPFSADNNDLNITYVPWHAGIYKNLAGQKFEYVCGATIVSAKVLITAANCFWNQNSGTIIDKSYYNVAAGKYFRDYDEHEPHAVFNNISEVIIPEDFRGDVNNYKSDIAILVLKNFLQFNAYIGPVCIHWQQGADKTISSKVFGRIATWGEDGSGVISKGLRTINVQSSSYADCKKQAGKELAIAIPTNKFCVLNKSDSVVCKGSGGGGFIEKNSSNGQYINNLWGVVSGGVPSNSKCLDYNFTTYTNIQYFEHVITKLMMAHQPY